MHKKIKHQIISNASIYIDRGAAVRKLGIPLSLFRKICIIKGIHPVLARGSKVDKSKIYYYRKDVRRIRADPLLEMYEKERIRNRRIKLAIARNELSKAEQLKNESEPISLANHIRERYPTFESALKAMSAALTSVALFATTPIDGSVAISSDIHDRCTKLMDYLYAFVAVSNCLTRCFASIKGYYFEIEVLSNRIVWLQPFRLPSKPDPSVDYRVMATFLELHLATAEFTVLKLYKLANYAFPPKRINKSTHSDGGFLNYRIEPVNSELLQGNDNTSSNVELFSRGTERKLLSELFKKQTIYIGKENDIFVLVFVLKACGAKKLGFPEPRKAPEELKFSEIDMEDAAITHQICDLPKAAYLRLTERLGEIASARSFVQPQWVFDSINFRKLLPTELYANDTTLPPHISPFDDTNREIEEYTKFKKLIGVNSENVADEEEKLDLFEERRALLTLSRNKRKLYRSLLAKKEREKLKHTI